MFTVASTEVKMTKVYVIESGNSYNPSKLRRLQEPAYIQNDHYEITIFS